MQHAVQDADEAFPVGASGVFRGAKWAGGASRELFSSLARELSLHLRRISPGRKVLSPQSLSAISTHDSQHKQNPGSIEQKK